MCVEKRVIEKVCPGIPERALGNIGGFGGNIGGHIGGNIGGFGAGD
jgi:hypothetical protein